MKRILEPDEIEPAMKRNFQTENNLDSLARKRAEAIARNRKREDRDTCSALEELAFLHLIHIDESQVNPLCPYCWHEEQDADLALEWATMRGLMQESV